MRCILAVLLLAVLGLALNRDAAAEEAGRKSEIKLHALPKVGSRAAILKDVDARDPDKESARLREYVREMMSAKEKRADGELQVIVTKIRAEQAARIAAENERRRRQANYDESWGSIAHDGQAAKAAPTRIRLDFQVPEIDSYRRAAEACRQIESFANDIVATLPTLDRDGDGNLSAEEYRDAGAILAGSSRVFSSLDGKGDGQISEADLSAITRMSAATAARAGRGTAEAANFRIGTYDADAGGTLDVNERKELTMAYVEAALRWRSEAEFYTHMADALLVARQVVAAKFANVEVKP